MDVSPLPLEGIRNNLAILEHHKLRVDGDVATYGLWPPADRGSDLTVAQADHLWGRKVNIASIGQAGFSGHRAVLQENTLTRGDHHIPGIPRTLSIACLDAGSREISPFC
jgi:hypothetical protein